MKSKKERLKMALKLAIGSGVVVYVLQSRMVDFTSLASVLFRPGNILLSLLFMLFTVLCCTTRWYLLVRAQGLSLTFKEIFELSMIGAFFNTFMPGSVGGDLVKAWYMAGQEPNKKTKAVFTVLLDRVIGLAVIIFYAAVTLLFYTQWLQGHRELQLLGYSLWAFTGVSILGAVFFFLPGEFRATTRLLEVLHRFKPLSKIIDAALLYRHYLSTVLTAILLSATSVLAINLLYSIQGSAIGIPMEVSRYFFIVPIALTVSAIPLLPGGIGVGQVAFFTLFQWIGLPNPEQGGTLCTLLQIYNILFSLFGAIFYLKFKRKPKMTLQFETPLSNRQARSIP